MSRYTGEAKAISPLILINHKRIIFAPIQFSIVLRDKVSKGKNIPINVLVKNCQTFYCNFVDLVLHRQLKIKNLNIEVMSNEQQ